MSLAERSNQSCDEPHRPFSDGPISKKVRRCSAEDPIVIRVPVSSSDCCQQPQIFNTDNSSLLADLLYPLDMSSFLNVHFRQSAVHIVSKSKAQRTEMISEALMDLNPGDILSETASEDIFCWVRDSTTHRLTSVKVDSHTAEILHKAGHSTYCRAPLELEKILVDGLNHDVGLERGEVEIFMGTEGHVTGWHTDFQENFTLQLSGTKKWRLRRGSAKHVLRGLTPHYQDPGSVEHQLLAGRLADPALQFSIPETETETVLQQPGDVLYFPAGMWHEVTTVEPGVSLNISLMGKTYASVICQALEHYLLTQDAFRKRVTTWEAKGSLTSLLSGLAHEVQGFSDTVGAQGILPPSLLSVPLRRQDDGEEQGENGSEGDGESSDIDLLESPYEVPVPYQYDRAFYERQLHQGYALRKNPLACLLLQKEITHYYYGSHVEDDELSCGDVLVLNVNYASGDMHDGPRVRKVFYLSRTERKALSCLLEGNLVAFSDIDDIEILNALLHYGGLVWVKPT